jgi:phosphoribosylglycinamide formyltransferase-1
MNILVLVSGNGSNLQALIDAQHEGCFKTAGTVPGTAIEHCIAAVISDRAGAYAIERAKAAGIPALIEEPDKLLSKEDRRAETSARFLAIAREKKIDLIILAGFLSILQGEILEEYRGRIINMHPSLLPKYGGQGMYGARVHKAVLAAEEKESGCTVHFVDEGTDTGPILLQRKVPVFKDDTAESLADRILKEEHIAIVEAAVLILEKLAKRNVTQ